MDTLTVIAATASGAIVGPTVNTLLNTVGIILNYLWGLIVRYYNWCFPTHVLSMQFTWDPLMKVPDPFMLYWLEVLKSAEHNTGTQGVFVNGEMKFAPINDFKHKGATVRLTFTQDVLKDRNGAEVSKSTIAHLQLTARNPKTLEEINLEISKKVAEATSKQYISTVVRVNSGSVYMEKMLFEKQATFETYHFENADLIKRRLDDVIHKRLPQLGLLLSGPPGGGKTSLIHAIMHYTGWNATIMNLAGCDDTSFRNIVYSSRRTRDNSGATDTHNSEKHIYIIEEIDTQIEAVRKDKRILQADDKKALYSPPKITLSTLLNVIQGISSPQQAIFVMTTNYKHVLREEIYRAMRVHLDLVMGPLDRARMEAIAHDKLPEWRAPEEIRDVMPAQLAKYLLGDPTEAELTEWVLKTEATPEVPIDPVIPTEVPAAGDEPSFCEKLRSVVEYMEHHDAQDEKMQAYVRVTLRDPLLRHLLKRVCNGSYPTKEVNKELIPRVLRYIYKHCAALDRTVYLQLDGLHYDNLYYLTGLYPEVQFMKDYWLSLDLGTSPRHGMNDEDAVVHSIRGGYRRGGALNPDYFAEDPLGDLDEDTGDRLLAQDDIDDELSEAVRYLNDQFRDEEFREFILGANYNEINRMEMILS